MMVTIVIIIIIIIIIIDTTNNDLCSTPVFCGGWRVHAVSPARLLKPSLQSDLSTHRF